MKYIIDKSFDFCYGHRVHNQRLNTKFTENGNNCLVCRHIHGHQGKVKVFLTSETNVEKTGMVTDFKHLGWFKNFIDDTIDHKFIMDLNDPLFSDEFPLLDENTLIDMKYFKVPDLTAIREYCDELIKNGNTEAQAQALFEKYEGAIFVDFVPTSENLSAWLLNIVKDKMKNLEGVEVVALEYWETPKSHCRVEA